MLARFNLVVGEAFRSISANLSTTIAATLTVLIGMFLLGLFIALGTWVVSWSANVERDLIVRVYFDRDATNAEINAVGNQLKGNAQVASYEFVSRDAALERMRERYPDYVANLTSNPLPASFEITPTNPDQLEAIAAGVSAQTAGVDDVRFGKQKADKVRKVARVIEIVFLAAAVVLLLAATLLIANTIRLSIFSRRREIEVMKLVGATNWFVRAPFMLEGLICGFLGSVAAIVLLFLGKELALGQILPRIGGEGDVKSWSFEIIALVLVGLGLALGAAGSGITIRRFLRV